MNSLTKKQTKKVSSLRVVSAAKEKTVTTGLKVAAKSPLELKLPPPIVGCFKGKDHDCL